MGKRGWGLSVLTLMLAASTTIWLARMEASVLKTRNDINVRLGETVLITESRGYYWFPNIYRLSDGQLFVKLGLGPDTTAPVSNFAAFCVSDDGGRTWSPRVSEGHLFSAGILEKYPNGQNKLIGVGFQLLLSGPGQIKELKDTLLEISDGWNEITHHRWIHASLPESPVWHDVDRSNGGKLTQIPSVAFHGCILPSKDGGLLVPMYGKFPGDKYYRSLLMKSRDRAQTWSYVSTIAKTDQPWPGMGDEGPNEPGLARLSDGRLICLLRTGFDGLMYQTDLTGLPPQVNSLSFHLVQKSPVRSNSRMESGEGL